MDRVAGTGGGGVNVPPSIAAIAFSVSLVMWGAKGPSNLYSSRGSPRLTRSRVPARRRERRCAQPGRTSSIVARRARGGAQRNPSRAEGRHAQRGRAGDGAELGSRSSRLSSPISSRGYMEPTSGGGTRRPRRSRPRDGAARMAGADRSCPHARTASPPSAVCARRLHPPRARLTTAA